jgi:hypothetical protein
MDYCLLFHSARATTLHVVGVVCALPVPLTAWLLTRTPRTEWAEQTGPTWWWIIPAALIAVGLVLPAAMLWLHDRYVLRLERTGDTIRLTTFLLWGQRIRELPVASFAGATVRHDPGQVQTGLSPTVNAPSLQMRMRDGKRLIFDFSGDAPVGWPAVFELFE